MLVAAGVVVEEQKRHSEVFIDVNRPSKTGKCGIPSYGNKAGDEGII